MSNGATLAVASRAKMCQLMLPYSFAPGCSSRPPVCCPSPWVAVTFRERSFAGHFAKGTVPPSPLCAGMLSEATFSYKVSLLAFRGTDGPEIIVLFPCRTSARGLPPFPTPPSDLQCLPPVALIGPSTCMTSADLALCVCVSCAQVTGCSVPRGQ